MPRHIILAALITALAAGPVLAEGPVDRILRDLRKLGYSQVDVERTLLGRTRIVADSPDASREIIVNPATGEILRDLWIPRNAKVSDDGSALTDAGDDDDDDDDGDDDGGDDGDDNSGSGGGDDGGGDDNSGHGGGGGDDD